MHNLIKHLTLDVHATLYMGLCPSTVIHSLSSVCDMHIIFTPEVNKRTVKMFLGITGSMLMGEDKVAAMKSLEVEVLWMDDNAAQVCCKVLFHSHSFADLILCRRFMGLSPLPCHVFTGWRHLSWPPHFTPSKHTSPCPTDLPSSTHHALPYLPAWHCYPSTMPLMVVGSKKNLLCKQSRKTMPGLGMKHWLSLSNIHFNFSCLITEADIELCGVWFRWKMPLLLLPMWVCVMPTRVLCCSLFAVIVLHLFNYF